jgi:hypothetical protein
VRRLESKYKGIDLPGARLTSRGTIRSVESSGGRRLLTVDLALEDGDGQIHTVGSAVVEATR